MTVRRLTPSRIKIAIVAEGMARNTVCTMPVMLPLAYGEQPTSVYDRVITLPEASGSVEPVSAKGVATVTAGIPGEARLHIGSGG